MKTTTPTPTEFCIPGRFWQTIPARQRSAEELEALRELLELEREERETVAEWLEGK